MFAGPLSASSGRWASVKLLEEPPSLCMELEGDQEFPWLFVRPLRILFTRKEGLFAEPFACEPRPLGLDKDAGRALEPSHVARGRSGVPLAFCTTLAHPFRSEGGYFAEPFACEPSSLGLGKVAGRAPEPPHVASG